jgi:hypothetical protein
MSSTALGRNGSGTNIRSIFGFWRPNLPGAAPTGKCECRLNPHSPDEVAILSAPIAIVDQMRSALVRGKIDYLLKRQFGQPPEGVRS